MKISADGAWRQVIGVVGSVHQMTLERDAEPHLYVPESQMPSPSLTLVVRSAADATNLAAGVRDAVRGVDAQVALGNVRTLEDVVAGAVAVRRFSMLLLVVFAAIAVTLTAVGVYGVVAHSVEQSTRELGVRLALGANVGSVVSTVLWRSLRVAVVGVAAGSDRRALLRARDGWTAVRRGANRFRHANICGRSRDSRHGARRLHTCAPHPED